MIKGIISISAMLVAFGAIILGILLLGGDIGRIIDAPSAVLVLLPTIAAIIATYPLSLLKNIPKHMKVFMGQEYNPTEYIDTIVALSEKARREGLLAFEQEQVDDQLMAYALRMMVDGLDKFSIKFALEDCMNGIKERHNEAVSIYDKAAAYAPAFGMCATVVALVNMLLGLDFEDPEAINLLGINMATALITTLYGSLFANIIFLPLAGRLKLLHKKEMFVKTMICNGLLSILNGDNPRVIKDYLIEQLSSTDNLQFKEIEQRSSQA